MRDLKFRAWSEYIGEMYYPGYEGDEAMIFYESCECPNLMLEVLMPPGAYIEGGEVIEIDSEYRIDNKAVFMQYTGLKDKNGKEIYEGDILKNPIAGDLWMVKYKDCAFYACLIGNDYETLLGSLEGFEIVGNVYENPELIK